MGNTLIDLPKDLQEKLDSRFTTDPKQIRLTKGVIELARAGRYHDFWTEAATPKMDLRAVLLQLNYGDLAQKVIDGAYDDESPDDKLPENTP